MSEALERMRALIEQVHRKVSIVDFALKHGKLGAGGKERRGPCPVCGSGLKSHSAPFAVYPQAGKWRCWADCGRGGDVVDLYREIYGGDALEAVKALLGGDYQPPKLETQTRAVESGRRSTDEIAAELWDRARPFEGSPAERYLRGRAIPVELLTCAADSLRFHPFAKWGYRDGAWIKAPAMIGRVVAPAGPNDSSSSAGVPTGGVHATYLQRGAYVRDKRLGKKMWGAQERDGRLGGVWLADGGDSESLGELVVAEGIETAASALAILAERESGVRAVAALALDRLQGRLLRDEQGRVADFGKIESDPAGRAFVWPAREGGGNRVAIAVDRDMSPMKLKGYAGKRRRPCDYELGSEARAQLCGRLAVQAWRAEGWRARAIAPSPNSDFNDDLKRLAGREAAA